MFIFGVSATYTNAADFNILPSSANFSLQQEVSVDIKIDSTGSSINAAEAKIQFPSNFLGIKSVSKEGSAFNFWLQEPTFSNETGELKFIAGTPNGISGASIQVLRIIFITKNPGTAVLSFSEGSISASDGNGTDVLKASNGASFSISNIPYTTSTPETVSVAPPVQITRKPTIVVGLPSEPIVKVSLYPDQSKWYNIVGIFTASWDLPADISGISTALNNNPLFQAPAKSEGLFDSKAFPPITTDGVYYLHIRYQNNNGWGKTAHYQIALDTQPPLPIQIEVKSGLSSDNPAPTLVLNTGDSLSGVSNYSITIGSEEPKIVDISEYTISPHPPGKYTIKVRAYDKANNSVEGQIELEILSIARPVISNLNKIVYTGSNTSFSASGTAIPDSEIIITVSDKNDSLVVQNVVRSNLTGAWTYLLDRELSPGTYAVTAQTRDIRGAISLPTEPQLVQVKDKPIFSLFGFDVTFKNLTWALVIILIALGLYYWRRVTIHLTKMRLKTAVVSGDLRNALTQVRGQLDNIDFISKKDTTAESKNVEYQYSNQKIRESLGKIEKYLTSDIEKLD